ncbi:hypothetical protein PO124_07175 [Bacillus licheniformis]|nr:hypothetical protein [Bacillus licheniformis]
MSDDPDMMQSVANFSRLGANSRNVDQLMADTIKEMQNRRKANHDRYR